MPSRFFVTGSDTNVGKTVVSAMLCAALDAVYWKPIQTGSREGTDRMTVMRLAELPKSRTVREKYLFTPPVSPHLAARLAGVRIDLRKIVAPKLAAEENLIAEGAGGVLVPVNRRQLMTDVMKRVRLPVVLVTRTALGTINHTLLSVAALRAARIDLRCVVMVGKPNKENQKAIEHYGAVAVAGTLPHLRRLDRRTLVRAFDTHFEKALFRE